MSPLATAARIPVIRRWLAAGGWFARWPRFAGLCAALVVARGVLVLSVLPPFEGWDEYQHLAYIVFLGEQHRAPVLGRDRVPASMYGPLAAYPHPAFSAAQLAGIGASTYASFWRQPRRQAPPPPSAGIELYQAQHPPLYYRLAAPLFRACGGLGGILSSMAALRLANLLLAAVAAATFAWGARRVLTDRGCAAAAALAVAANPSLLLNATRVGNDALAVLLGTLAAVLLVPRPTPQREGRALLAGVLLGLAAIAKMTALVLLPAALLAVTIPSPGRRPLLRRALALLLLCAGFLLPTARHFRANIQAFGTPVVLHGLTREGPREAGLPGLISQVGRIDWPRLAARLYLRDTLWVGGWSYLTAPPLLYVLHGGLLAAGLLGYLALARRQGHRPGAIFLDRNVVPYLLLITAGTAAGLAYHALRSLADQGYIATNGWYGALGLPWLIVLAVGGASALRGGIPLALALAGVGLITELYGICALMVPEYTGGAQGCQAWRRLAELHPFFPAPWVVPLALGTAVLLAALAATAVTLVGRAADGVSLAARTQSDA